MEQLDRGAVVAGGMAGLALAAMHFALWGALEDKPRPTSYIIGVSTLLTAYSGWAGACGGGRYIRGLWIITALAGLGDLGAYAIREQHKHLDLAALFRALKG